MNRSFLSGVSAIIFDLGGVIVNLDTQRTIQAFSALTGKSVADILAFTQGPVFHQYERGELNDSQFRDYIRNSFAQHWSNAEIDRAWNAMIIDIPSARLNLLSTLSKSLPVFILSNTNQIHIDFIEQQLLPLHQVKSFAALVHKDYYSHTMGMRKPDPQIFVKLMETHELSFDQTLLVDDNLENIEAANALGLKTYHVPPNRLNLNIFYE